MLLVIAQTFCFGSLPHLSPEFAVKCVVIIRGLPVLRFPVFFFSRFSYVVYL